MFYLLQGINPTSYRPSNQRVRERVCVYYGPYLDYQQIPQIGEVGGQEDTDDLSGTLSKDADARLKPASQLCS